MGKTIDAIFLLYYIYCDVVCGKMKIYFLTGPHYIYACFQGRVGTVKSELAGSNLMSACLRQWEQ